jgi:hypothetical protein
MIIRLPLTQTHDGETPKQLTIYHELMIGPISNHRTHSSYPPPRRSIPDDDDDDVFYLFLQKQKSAQIYIPQEHFLPYEAV